MVNFNYHRPETVAAAAELIRSADSPTLLAGGMTLLPTMKLRLAEPSDLVDLAGIDALRAIRRSPEAVEIGAMVTHADVAASPDVRAGIPALAALAGGIGDPQVRNRGTLGGSIANSDPAADYPAAVLGLGASVLTDRREIAADDYFQGLFETALEESEIIERVRFPYPSRAAYQKLSNPASRYAVVGVFVAETTGGVRVAVTGAGACAFRVPAMEAALSERFSSSAVDGLTIAADEFNEDIHASAEYRAHQVVVLAKRAVDAITRGA